MEVIKQHYPEAVTIRSLAEQIIRDLNSKDLSISKTIWATSLCADEANNAVNILSVLFAGNGPFNLGGLSGLPFIGKTGLLAFASHIPTNGGAFIIYGPHIGVTNEGELGKIRRDEQVSDSNCCGSINVGVETAKSGIKPLEVDRLDPQQNRVEQILFEKKDEILNAPNPMKAATEIIYNRTHQRIHEMVASTEEAFKGTLVYTMGGILINSNWDKEDSFEVRDVKFYDFR